jgi:hypothetical protein
VKSTALTSMGVFNRLSGLFMKELGLSVAVMSVLWFITCVYQRRMFYRLWLVSLYIVHSKLPGAF